MKVEDIELTAPVCGTCGTQFEPGTSPTRCPICEDERQYVLPGGQTWTSIQNLVNAGHRNEIRELENDLYEIVTAPRFAIGQRALLVRTNAGNVLWDAVSLVDNDTLSRLHELGGVDAMAVSHPHFFSSMVSWSRALGDVPIHLPESARAWVQRPSPSIRYFEGNGAHVFGGVTLHRTGGHFDSSQVALWRAGAEGRGVLLSADEPIVTPGGDGVSFMYSFPNLIPLHAFRLRQVLSVLEQLSFDRIYSGWPGQVVQSGARGIVGSSGARYLEAVGG
jgi:hypothetical protein